jgi:hypothetical protein
MTNVEHDKVGAPVDYFTDAKGITEIFGTAMGVLYPSTEKIFNELTRDKFANALAPVLEKYGMSLGGVFGRWGVEINLAFVTAQFAIPIGRAISENRHRNCFKAGISCDPANS